MSAESAGPLASLLWGPVVLVTAAAGDRRSGQVAISCIAASIVPGRPRLLASLWRLNLTHDLVAESGALAVHTLRRDQIDLVKWFGLRSGRQVDKLAGREWRPGRTGAPILADCLGWAEGRVVNAMAGGDMTVFLIDLIDGALGGPPDDLLTWAGLRERMDADLIEANEARRNRQYPWNRDHLDDIAGPIYRPPTGAAIADPASDRGG